MMVILIKNLPSLVIMLTPFLRNWATWCSVSTISKGVSLSPLLNLKLSNVRWGPPIYFWIVVYSNVNLPLVEPDQIFTPQFYHLLSYQTMLHSFKKRWKVYKRWCHSNCFISCMNFAVVVWLLATGNSLVRWGPTIYFWAVVHGNVLERITKRIPYQLKAASLLPEVNQILHMGYYTPV